MKGRKHRISKKIIAISLSEKMLDEVDMVSLAVDRTRSAFIREALTYWIKALERKGIITK